MSNTRTIHLKELQSIIEEISRAIMWVNDREEEELMFDWGDKNIDNYIPRKQESYSVRHTPTCTHQDQFATVILHLTIGLTYNRVKVQKNAIDVLIPDDVTFFLPVRN